MQFIGGAISEKMMPASAGPNPQAQNVHFQDLVPAHFVHFVAGAISEKMMPASARPNPPSSKSAFPRLSAGPFCAFCAWRYLRKDDAS